jgi:shikimate kinase
MEMLVAHAFNPSTWEGGRGRQISEFEASLVYKVSSRTARTSEKPCLEKTKKKKKEYGNVFMKRTAMYNEYLRMNTFLKEELESR